MKRPPIWLLASVMLSMATHASQIPDVDIFPSQSWDSLQGDASAPARSASSASAVAQAPELDDSIPVRGGDDLAAATMSPFQAVGEWVEGDQRIVIVESEGQTYLLCQRCPIGEAIRPGGALAKNYRLRALEEQRAVLLDPQGRTLIVNLAPLAQ